MNVNPWVVTKIRIAEQIDAQALARLVALTGAPVRYKAMGADPLDFITWLEGQPNASGTGPKVSATDTAYLRELLMHPVANLANAGQILIQYENQRGTP